MDLLTIQGFKSIRDLESFELKKLNIFIGANGGGKTNLISFFCMLRDIIDGNLSDYVRENSGAGDILYNGRKTTEEMYFQAMSGARGYRFTLKPTPKDTFIITDEARYYKWESTGWRKLRNSDSDVSSLVEEAKSSTSDNKFSRFVYDSISSWQIYHFYDTSATAGMRQYEIIQDNKCLRPDAANIAPFLYHLKKQDPNSYDEILKAVRLVIPFFDNFQLEVTEFKEKQKLNLTWNQQSSDYPMQPYHLSDGSSTFERLKEEDFDK